METITRMVLTHSQNLSPRILIQMQTTEKVIGTVQVLKAIILIVTKSNLL